MNKFNPGDGTYWCRSCVNGAPHSHHSAFIEQRKVLPVRTTGWGPPVISWFINHYNHKINYSYIYHKPLFFATKINQRFTLSTGGPILYPSDFVEISGSVSGSYHAVVVVIPSHVSSVKRNSIHMDLPQSQTYNVYCILMYSYASCKIIINQKISTMFMSDFLFNTTEATSLKSMAMSGT